MSKYRVSKNRSCPFYCRETASSITCSGIQEGATTTVGFSNRTNAVTHKTKYCFKYDNSCPIRAMLKEINND